MPNWTARLIAFVIVAACLVIQFMIDTGWFTFVGMFLWPAAGLCHVLAHSIRLPPSGKVQGRRLALVVVSHLLFIVAFLLQWDQGLTITELLARTGIHWWPDWPLGDLDPYALNVYLFLPVLATWILLITRRQT